MLIHKAFIFKMNHFLLSIILTLLPVSELRGGLPLAVDYALRNNLPVFPIFFLIVMLNISMIFLIFFFLDFLHHKFMSLTLYRKIFGFWLNRVRKKVDKIERKLPVYGWFALTFFVAVPLPITGAWTGCLIAWTLGLERKKSIMAIMLGVMVAGLIVLATSVGVLSLFSLI